MSFSGIPAMARLKKIESMEKEIPTQTVLSRHRLILVYTHSKKQNNIYIYI